MVTSGAGVTGSRVAEKEKMCSMAHMRMEKDVLTQAVATDTGVDAIQ